MTRKFRLFFYLKDFRARVLRGLQPTQQIKPVNIFRRAKDCVCSSNRSATNLGKCEITSVSWKTLFSERNVQIAPGNELIQGIRAIEINFCWKMLHLRKTRKHLWNTIFDLFLRYNDYICLSFQIFPNHIRLPHNVTFWSEDFLAESQTRLAK